MRITTIAVAGLLASTLVTASPAQAEVAAQPALSHFYPLRPSPSLSPQSEAEELRRQIADLDAAWGSLTPDQRNQRIAGLQQQVTQVDLDSRNLPQDQKAQVDAILLPSLVHLASLLAKVQTPPTSPCIFPLCLPGL
ncbi:MAG: hypothetical protein QOH91_3276 [Mycobacterium sp.]|jgi:hypothetical protein|nr:hypothetical protein [Mycobacterium sp.]